MHDRAALWSDMGLGKTRSLLIGTGPDLVIAPAAVRDTEVWAIEAQNCDLPSPRVISYHEAPKLDPDDFRGGVLVLDESHRLKERKTRWHDPIWQLAKRFDRIYESSGTPMPNNALELWGQLRMLRQNEHQFKYYWPWVKQWFDSVPTRWDPYAISENLKGCTCRQPDDLDSSCEHWQEFYRANMAGYTRRLLFDDVLSDLPPLTGVDTPMWTPMTAAQAKLYKALMKDFLATLPAEGILLEALTDSAQFVMLRQLSSGLSVLDPAADPGDKHSGKLALVRELLADRRRPTVVAAWYRNSAAALVRVCKDLHLSHLTMGANMTPKQRTETMRRFRAGGIDVLVGSIGVIKEGVDGLQYASDAMVLFERSWVPGDNQQLIRRLQRLGQTRPVLARQLVTPDSVDAAQWKTVGTKSVQIRRTLSPLEVASLIDGG